MSSDTLNGTIFVAFLLALITICLSFKMKNDELEAKTLAAFAQEGLEQRCDATTGHRTIWVKPTNR
jgi:hypothetical protein